MANAIRNLASSAGLVASGTLMSRGLGFLRDILIAHYFSHTATDVFYSAFRLPNLFRRLFGEGALTVSFIPVFSEALKKDPQRAKHLSSSIFTILFLILSVLTACGIIYAGPIIENFTEGFAQIPGKLELTVHQSQIMFGYIILVSVYAFYMGILNSLDVFWLPAMAPALWNLAMIVGILVFRNVFQVPSDVLAWAAMVGGVLQMAILIPPLIRKGFFPGFTVSVFSPEVFRVFKSLGPSILGLSVMQIGVIINTHFASHLEDGSNSYIFLADRILELPLALFAVSVGTVALPALSRLWADGRTEEMSALTRQGMQMTWFLAFPCAAALLVLSEPIVQTLFQHGQFSRHGAQMTAGIVRIYGFGLVFAAGVRILAPSFYAMKNTWLPALSAAVALGLHIFMAPYFMNQYGLLGLAASSTLSSLVNLSILLVCFRFFVGKLGWPSLIKSISIYAVCCLALVLPSPLYQYLINSLGDFQSVRIMALALTIALCSGMYFVAAYLFKAEQLMVFLSIIKRKIRR